MQFFMSAFPDCDFSQLVETDDEQEMAANIQALIDMLSQTILMYDLEHIKGDQIVSGNAEHCINLLQLAKEISIMMNSNSNEMDPNQLQDQDGDSNDSNNVNEGAGHAGGHQHHEGMVDSDEEVDEAVQEEMLAMQRELVSLQFRGW